ncbi:MAG TPA: GNAT family N-acetyltransferase [Tepidisphaeraceae bacterium]|nr:GNAT family N-acetyltransferase [Tepidisphaeraceae bacterium]
MPRDPTSVIIRPTRAADVVSVAHVHIAAWQTAYRGILPDAFLASLSQEKHEERHRRYLAKPGTIHFVAELPQHEVVGFVMGGTERSGDGKYRGEMYAIYLLAEHRRRGIGAALARRWAQTLRDGGINSALVWVLSDNQPAAAFYQRLGARELRQQPIDIGGISLRETAYGWDDLNLIP